MAYPQFTYTDNVPQAAQTISSTQVPILNNFGAINEIIGVDHVSFQDAINYGKHNKTSFPIQDSDQDTSTNEMALYAKATTTTNGIELFYRYPNNGTVVQYTGIAAAPSGGSSLAAASGYSYLPGGLILKWGSLSGNFSSSIVVSFPTSGFPPYTTAVYSVQYSTKTGSATTYMPVINDVTLTSFTLSSYPGYTGQAVSWIAIGL
jgi:hypothetical protein